MVMVSSIICLKEKNQNCFLHITGTEETTTYYCVTTLVRNQDLVVFILIFCKGLLSENLRNSLTSMLFQKVLYYVMWMQLRNDSVSLETFLIIFFLTWATTELGF